MEFWIVSVLCVCVAGSALGLPQAQLIDSSSMLSSEDQRDGRLTDLSSVSAQPPPQVLRSSPSQAENAEPSDLEKKTPIEVSKMKVEEKKVSEEEQSRVPSLSEAKLNLKFPEDQASQSMVEAGDNVRAKKSTLMQDEPHTHGPHTTTVCIQVRSDHQPRVVCGDPLNESKKVTDMAPSSKARFAYASPNDYYPHTLDQQRLPYMASPLQAGYMRASPQEMQDMGRPPMKPVSSSQIGPNKSPNLIRPGGPMSGRPKAANGPLPVSMYASKRSEDEPIGPKIGDANLPQGHGSTPIRIQPPGILPPPNSVVVHKQYYQPPPFAQGYYSPPLGPLRLNCAPDAFGPAYVRNVPPEGYIPYLRSGPVEERLLLSGEVPRMAEVQQYIDEQDTYIMDPQARQAFQDDIVGSPYASPDGLSGTLFIDENGQTYMMNDNQANLRSAVDQNMWEQDQYLGAEPKKQSPLENTRRPEEELKLANEKLKELQKQLEILKKKTEMEPKKEVEEKKPEPIKEPSRDSTPDIVDKKPDLPKSTKRHAYRMK